MQYRWKRTGQRTAAGLMLSAGLLSTGLAQSIDISPSRVTVGQPLKLHLLVRDFEPGARTGLAHHCFQVDLRQGDAPWPAESLQWQAQPVGSDGQWRLQVTSALAVQEPTLQARVALLCGAPLVREFTLLAEPPEASTHTAQSLPQPLPPLQPVPSRQDRSAPPNPRKAATAHARPRLPPPETQPPRLQLDEVLNAAPTSAGTTVPHLSALAPVPADTALPAAIQSLWLQELQGLHEEQRQTRATLMALNARLERAERDTWRHGIDMASGIAGLLLAGLLLRVLREVTLKRVHSWLPPDKPSRAPRFTPATPPAEPAPVASFSPDNRSPVSASLEWPSHMARYGQPTELGQAALDDPPCSAALAQVDALSANGYHGASAAALEHALHSHVGKSPWILLRLLDLYRTLNQPWNHERVSAELEAIYNVRVPLMAEGPGEGRSLEDQPHSWPRICQLWFQPDAAAQLAALLLRPTRLEVLDLAAFRDALMLYAMCSPALNDRQPGSVKPMVSSSAGAEDWALVAAVP